MKKIYLILVGFTIIGLASIPIQAQENTKPQITNILTNYPIDNDGVDNFVNVPNTSTKLTIGVEAPNAKAVRFYSASREDDKIKQLIYEDTDSTNGFNGELKYDVNDGFSWRIIIEAISKDGTTTSKEFIANKTINE